MADTAASGGETLAFQAEVGRLLDIVAHSLYSDRRVFLRELISNASDACDRLRYEALTRPELAPPDTQFRIELLLNKEARTLTVADNGIGMNRAALIENLGTIARSGTAAPPVTSSGRDASLSLNSAAKRMRTTKAAAAGTTQMAGQLCGMAPSTL